MICWATSKLATLFLLLYEQAQALESWDQVFFCFFVFLKSVLQKRMACYKPGYKVRTGVREGHFLPETEFPKSPSLSFFFPKMVGGG